MNTTFALFACIALLVAAAGAFAADDQPIPATRWVNISDAVTKPLIASGTKITWPGDTAGVAVDPANGDLYMVVTNTGLWKSTDHGDHFTPIAHGQISGRCSFGHSFYPDPAGSRIACFMIYGKAGMTLDGGQTWKTFADEGKNWDFGAVDWSDPQAKTLWAIRHEADGACYLSHDAGTSWIMFGKHPDFDAVGIFGDHILVAGCGKGIVRSTDSGKSWTVVSPERPAGRVAIPYHGKTYWVAGNGLIASTDDGATWQQVGSPVKALWGPLFGKDETQIMLADEKGFIYSSDAGQTWKRIADMPVFTQLKPTWSGEFLCIAWDARANILYASRMANPTYRLELGWK